ncbi:Type II secretion system F domain protein [Solidesulfovibrio fructosivorans JJ]]|uniref:Type II secretion system F domain protein n=1 Tax=Solidesulfovibrio fructosivorans JJ] TaxID=596151 RepID=E1JZJ8_SOLFR|nr:type II secretion system F family protein [Solidesulfovibrio fructosivorans]EFL50245.1 Type II secretion system F domain protein [Solidesulfovibrio fructosivorans JJ]]
MQIILISLLVSASVGFFVYAVMVLRDEREKRREIAERAMAVLHPAGPEGGRRPGVIGWLAGLGRGLAARFGEAVKPKEAEELSKTRTTLIHAGFRQPGAVEIYWGLKVGAALVGLLVGVFLAASGRIPAQYKMFAALACVAGGFYLPGVVLDSRVKKRQKAILHGLPDALDLLVVCVEAGMGLDAAIYRVCLEMTHKEPILSSELRLLTLELRAGKSRREALKNLSNRVGLEDMGSLVAMLIQTDMFGTSIAQTLRVYADSMRTKRFQLAEELAAKLPVKLLFPLVLFIFPTLLIVILGPAGISLMRMFSSINR